MNLLSLILIFLGLIVGISVFYIAWQLSSGTWDPTDPVNKKEPGESKEPNDSPGS
jgi:hypothetical protein